MITIKTKKELLELKKIFQVRDDWHEPDEQDLTAKCVGNKFDNAGFDDEKHIVLSWGQGTKIEYRINLATLLALATDHEDGSVPLR